MNESAMRTTYFPEHELFFNRIRSNETFHTLAHNSQKLFSIEFKIVFVQTFTDDALGHDLSEC